MSFRKEHNKRRSTENGAPLFTICFSPATKYNQKVLYCQRFGIFFLFEKENACKRKANEPFPLDTRNAAPQYIARGSQSVARHIRPQTRRSLNECGLVRLASQAVPSPNPVGFYHCGAAIGSLIKKIGLVTCFYFARVQKTRLVCLFKSFYRLRR